MGHTIISSIDDVDRIDKSGYSVKLINTVDGGGDETISQYSFVFSLYSESRITDVSTNNIAYTSLKDTWNHIICKYDGPRHQTIYFNNVHIGEKPTHTLT